MFTRSVRLFQISPAIGSSIRDSLFRSYSDTLRRRAIRVLSPEEAENLGKRSHRKKEEDPSSIQENHDFGHVGPDQVDILPEGVTFEKLNEIDKRLNPVIHAIRNKKIREKKNFVMLEGAKLIKDALTAGAQLKYLYFTKLELLKDFPLDKDVRLFKLKTSHLKLWSDLVMPPGVVAICEKPTEAQLQFQQEEQLPLTLICDNIRDPGNIGTILRIAAAAGCAKVLATKGCADVWDPKVVRAGAGSHFSVPVINHVEWHQIDSYINKDSSVYLADSKLTSEHLDEKLNVPFCELWQTEFEPNKDTVLVMGGESHGLSKAAYELARKFNGDRVNIPMTTRTESLNAAVAAAVILFEIRKQMLQKLI